MEPVLLGSEDEEDGDDSVSLKMHWAREPVFQMLSVMAGKLLSIGHVGGKTSFAARSWMIDRMVVWKVVGA